MGGGKGRAHEQGIPREGAREKRSHQPGDDWLY